MYNSDQAMLTIAELPSRGLVIYILSPALYRYCTLSVSGLTQLVFVPDRGDTKVLNTFVVVVFGVPGLQ